MVGHRLMEVGKLYPVPHVRARLLTQGRPRWWAVLGPAHDDREYIEFHHRHYHIDYRFLTDDDLREIHAFNTGALNPPLDPTLLVITNTAPENWDPRDPRNSHTIPAVMQYLNGRTMYVGLPLESLPTPEYPTGTYIRTRRRKMQRQNGGPDRQLGWISILRRAYENSKLLPGMICPHRGADLSRISQDEEGVITCPLRRPRWRADTGEGCTAGRIKRMAIPEYALPEWGRPRTP